MRVSGFPFRSSWLLRPFVLAVLAICAICWNGPDAGAQATLGVSGSSGIVAKTGHTELAGAVTFTVSSGTTAAGDIEISLFPSTLTGANSGITITAINPGAGLVKLTVPSGATVGDSVTLDGIRVSVANEGIESLVATVSMTGNFVTAGNTQATLIQKVLDPLVVDPDADSTFTFNTAGVLVDAVGAFTFTESFVDAFSGDVGALGRTVATQVIVRVTAIPENVSVTLPGVITSQNGATLTTGSGMAETVSDTSSTNEITYTFTESGNSGGLIDTFSFTPTLTTSGTAGSGTAFIQIKIGPIGAAPPTSALASTAIPRYQEQLLPAAIAPTLPVTKEFVFPVQSGATTEQVVISNTTVGAVRLTYQARDAAGQLVSGAGITNPATATLPSHETSIRTIADLFGEGATTASVASVDVLSQSDLTVGSTEGQAPAAHSPRTSRTPSPCCTSLSTAETLVKFRS